MAAFQSGMGPSPTGPIHPEVGRPGPPHRQIGDDDKRGEARGVGSSAAVVPGDTGY